MLNSSNTVPCVESVAEIHALETVLLISERIMNEINQLCSSMRAPRSYELQLLVNSARVSSMFQQEILHRIEHYLSPTTPILCLLHNSAFVCICTIIPVTESLHLYQCQLTGFVIKVSNIIYKTLDQVVLLFFNSTQLMFIVSHKLVSSISMCDFTPPGISTR